jgi:hypothetical protein
MRAIDDKMEVRQVDDRRFEAIRPRRLGLLRSRLTVETRAEDDGSVALLIDSRPVERGMLLIKDDPMYLDHAKSIHSVEEFQRQLQWVAAGVDVHPDPEMKDTF